MGIDRLKHEIKQLCGRRVTIKKRDPMPKEIVFHLTLIIDTNYQSSRIRLGHLNDPYFCSCCRGVSSQRG